MTNKVKIRPAEAMDIPACAKKLSDFHDTIALDKSLKPSPLRMLEILTNLAQHHVFLVAEHEGSIVGAIAGHFTSHPYRPDLTLLAEIFWLTDPSHRGKGVGGLLLKAYMAASARVDGVTMTIEHNTRLPDGYLEKNGFFAQETSYIKMNKRETPC